MKFDLLAASCGGGRNMAYLIGMYERGIRPEVILFADTKGEKPGTYTAIEMMDSWLVGHGMPGITVVTKNSIYDSLEDNCLKKNMLPSKAYGWSSCSDKWKIQPQEKFMNNYQPAIDLWKRGGRVTKAIGFDASEPRRADKSPTDDPKYIYWHPLIEWGWFLQDCIEAFSRHGLQVPPKSACFYCPSSKKHEIIQLSVEHPELMARALRMEENAAQNLQTVKGLGRRFSWREFLSSEKEKQEEMPDPPELHCSCADAGEGDE